MICAQSSHLYYKVNSAAEERERNEKHIRPFDRSLPMQLLRARDAVMQHFRPHLRGHGITEQQWRVLRVLAAARLLEILEISERCCILPASLSLMLPKLEGRIDLASEQSCGSTAGQRVADRERSQLFREDERRVGEGLCRTRTRCRRRAVGGAYDLLGEITTCLTAAAGKGGAR